MSRASRRDRGAADALGLVLIAPVAIGLAILVIALGRRVDANAQVRSAAESAAQAAALERDPVAARSAAEATARAMLGRDSSCEDFSVEVDYGVVADGSLGANDGQVAVSITCVISNDGIEAVQSSPGRADATAYATLDRFRSGGAP